MDGAETEPIEIQPLLSPPLDAEPPPPETDLRKRGAPPPVRERPRTSIAIDADQLKKFIDEDYRNESGTLRKEIANLQGQLMRAEKLEFHALDYQHDLLWTSKGALLLLLVCVVASVPNLYGYMITLCALMAIFFIANALLSLVTFGSLLYFIELPNIFLVVLSFGVVLYRWIFALSIKSVTSWAVNVLVSVIAVFAFANWMAGINLEHSRLHVIAFIAERAAYRRHRKSQ